MSDSRMTSLLMVTTVLSTSCLPGASGQARVRHRLTRLRNAGIKRFITINLSVLQKLCNPFLINFHLFDTFQGSYDVIPGFVERKLLRWLFFHYLDQVDTVAAMDRFG